MIFALAKFLCLGEGQVSSIWIIFLRLGEGFLLAKVCFTKENPRVSSDQYLFHLGEGFFVKANLRLLLLQTWASLRRSLLLAVAKPSLHLVASPQRTSASNSRFFFLNFLPFPCLLFLLILQNISKWGISVIFRNIGVNLAFRLHKHLENTL